MNKTDNRSRRRWLNIGPGLIIAIIISIVLVVNWQNSENQSRKMHSGPPIIERQTITSSYEEKSGPIPEIGFILVRKDKLSLTEQQLSRLRQLETDWKKYYAPKIALANEAAQRTGEYLADAKDDRSTPAAHIQKEAAPLVALSREISDTRRSYWNRATDVLDQKQRGIVQKERENDWAARKRKISADAVKK